VWDFFFIDLCPEHLAVLVDTCTDCGELLVWRGRDLTKCGCNQGGDLKKARALKVSRDQARATAVVQGLLRDDRYASEAAVAHALPPLARMGPGHAVEFLVRLGFEAAAVRPRRRTFAFEPLGDGEIVAHEALSRGLEAVELWPDGLYSVLDDMRRRRIRGPEESPRLCSTRILNWASRLPDGGGEEVGQAVNQYVAVERRRMAASD
jgi:hypothetical protein